MWSATSESSLTVNWLWPAISRKLPPAAGIISDSSMVTLIAMWWLDWCYQWLSLVLTTATPYLLAPLQWVQNGAAELVVGLGWRAHFTPALKRLHWLPVKYSLVQDSGTSASLSPSLLSSVSYGHCHIYDSDTAVHRLRSSTTHATVVKRTRTQFGQRVFSVAGPDIWNSLPCPPEIRLTENFATIKNKLKTHLFDMTFS